MSFLIAYDIKDDKRLRKIAKYTESKALRIQLSLYLLENIKKKEFIDLIHKLKNMMDEEDDLRIYKIDLKKTIYFESNKDIKKMII
jgi:CRISPR-associated protein Cas2